MAFDVKAFRTAQFTPRIGEVKVPELASFFGDDPPVWKVRNLTAAEVARVGTVGDDAKTAQAMLAAITSKDSKEIADAVKGLLGLDGELKPEHRRHLLMIELATVEPAGLSHQDIVRLGEVAAHSFNMIIAKINELYGKGAEPGKLPASTKTKK